MISTTSNGMTRITSMRQRSSTCGSSTYSLSSIRSFPRKRESSLVRKNWTRASAGMSGAEILCSHMLNDDAVHDVGDVVEPVDDLFEVVVDLVADEEAE